MKHTIYILLLAITICFPQCCKEKPHNNNTDVPGLPPATQTGANTLGFLLNGVPWVPAGNNGTANMSIDFDPGFNNGGMGIAAYKVIANNNLEYFGIGIADSLNFLIPQFNLPLRQKSLFRITFVKGICEYFSIDSSIVLNGELTINKLDRVNNIIAGTFNATLFKPGCDTIRITEGRFDMKF